MQGMPSSTWSEPNRTPVATSFALGAERFAASGHATKPDDSDDKWPGYVRLALFAAGVSASWGGVWLIIHEAAKAIHGGT